MQLQSNYFSAYDNLKMTRDDKGVLVAEFHSNGGPFIMTAQSHTEFVDAFYRIAQDRANKIVILTGAGGDFIADVEWSSFGDVADPAVWSQVHDEGVQVLENIANIRVPVIAALEGRAHVHSDYALLASVIVAAEGATFQDVAHFAVGVAPGDGIFTTWSYRAGAGRAEAFLLNPQPLSARTAQEWGVVAEVVPNGKALSRARELAELYLKAPEVTRRNEAHVPGPPPAFARAVSHSCKLFATLAGSPASKPFGPSRLGFLILRHVSMLLTYQDRAWSQNSLCFM
jgi:enoyl-CoA hydratase/carnithine racemase